MSIYRLHQNFPPTFDEHYGNDFDICKLYFSFKNTPKCSQNYKYMKKLCSHKACRNLCQFLSILDTFPKFKIPKTSKLQLIQSWTFMNFSSTLSSWSRKKLCDWSQLECKPVTSNRIRPYKYLEFPRSKFSHRRKCVQQCFDLNTPPVSQWKLDINWPDEASWLSTSTITLPDTTK